MTAADLCTVDPIPVPITVCCTQRDTPVNASDSSPMQLLCACSPAAAASLPALCCIVAATRERLQRAYDGFHCSDVAGLAHITEYADLDGPNIPVPGGQPPSPFAPAPAPAPTSSDQVALPGSCQAYPGHPLTSLHARALPAQTACMANPCLHLHPAGPAQQHSSTAALALSAHRNVCHSDWPTAQPTLAARPTLSASQCGCHARRRLPGCS